MAALFNEGNSMAEGYKDCYFIDPLSLTGKIKQI